MPVVAVAPEVIVGLAVLLFLFATEPIWYPAALQVIDGLPGLFQPPLTAFVNQMRSWINAFHGWLDGSLAPAALTLWQWWWAQYAPIAAIVPMLESLYNSLHRINYGAIPHALASAFAHADDLYNQLYGITFNEVAQAEAAAAAGTASAFAHADDLYNQLYGIAFNEVAQAEAAAAAGIASAFAHADDLYNQLYGIAFNEVAALRSVVAQDVQNLEGAIGQGIQAAEQAASGWVEQLRSDTAQAIRDVQGLLENDVAQAAAVAAAATAAAEGEIQAIRDLDCIKFCNILGGIGQLLQDLELVGLLALLAEAYANPSGARDTIQNELVGPAEQLLSDVTGLFGIKAA